MFGVTEQRRLQEWPPATGLEGKRHLVGDTFTVADGYPPRNDGAAVLG